MPILYYLPSDKTRQETLSALCAPLLLSVIYIFPNSAKTGLTDKASTLSELCRELSQNQRYLLLAKVGRKVAEGL